MTEISFKSTYSIPLVGQSVTVAKRAKLKKMASKYQNVMYPNGSDGNVRVSIRKRLDNKFVADLKQIGFKVFKVFDRHNVPKTEGKMDAYIRQEIKSGNYKQYGKQKKHM